MCAGIFLKMIYRNRPLPDSVFVSPGSLGMLDYVYAVAACGAMVLLRSIRRSPTNRLRQFLNQQVSQGLVPCMSLQVRRAGRVVFEHYCGHAKPGQLFTPDTICRFYSTTKPMVAVVVLRLIEQGLIALDDPIDKHIPEWHDSMVRVQSGKLLDSSCAAHTPITVRHLLVSHPSAEMCAVLSKDCAASCTASYTAACTASCPASCAVSCGINPNSDPPNSKPLTSPCEVHSCSQMLRPTLSLPVLVRPTLLASLMDSSNKESRQCT